VPATGGLAGCRHRRRQRDGERERQPPDFVGHVRAALAGAGATGLPAGRLKLEITESIVMDESADARAVLDEIRGLGARLQMDDFGTGYSSLSCLNKLPLDGLKIDRAFIRDVSFRRDAVAVLQAITALAHNLKMEVVAEGLETADQVALLQSLECDYGQGYHFAKPLAAEAAAAFLAAGVPAAEAAGLSA
jgi:EAL domain-containing protein (putative c-di-GMP-specific phosphodiesterase class I)